MTALRGCRVFRRGDRLCDMVSHLCLYLDMQTIAFEAISERPVPPGVIKGVHASLVSTLFDVCVQFPIFSPFAASFNATLAAPYEITIVDGGMPPDLEEYHSPELRGASLMLWNMALVFFYEQQLNGIRATFGRKTDDIENNWPDIVRFAWALRNAAAHHHGALNFTSNVRPVQWHHLQYDARDNGKKVIGETMHPADVLIFLIEFSDELDRLGIAA